MTTTTKAYDDGYNKKAYDDSYDEKAFVFTKVKDDLVGPHSSLDAELDVGSYDDAIKVKDGDEDEAIGPKDEAIDPKAMALPVDEDEADDEDEAIDPKMMAQPVDVDTAASTRSRLTSAIDECEAARDVEAESIYRRLGDELPAEKRTRKAKFRAGKVVQAKRAYELLRGLGMTAADASALIADSPGGLAHSKGSAWGKGGRPPWGNGPKGKGVRKG